MTQTDDVIAHLESGRRINPMESLRLLGIARLAARILDAKQRGLDIQSRMVTGIAANGRRYAVKEYWLVEATK